VAGRSVEDVGVVAARGAGEGDVGDGVVARGTGKAARGAGDGAARGAGEEAVVEGRRDAFGSRVLGAPGGARGAPTASVEAPKDDPADKNLCGDSIGASTVSDASKNSRVVGVEGSSRSAKGKAVSSKMTCLEMIIWLEDMSRQRYPLW
jgi:hypothetical protein